MTTEIASLMIRRKPQTAREAANRREALSTLAQAGWSLQDIEMEGMTVLDLDDMGSYYAGLAAR